MFEDSTEVDKSLQNYYQLVWSISWKILIEWYLILFVYSNFIVCHPLHFVRHLIVILQIVENSSFLILCNILHHHQILFSLLFFEPTVLLTNKLSIVFTLFVCLHACYLEIPNNRDPWIRYKCFRAAGNSSKWA